MNSFVTSNLRKFEKIAAPFVDQQYIFQPAFKGWRAFWISPSRGKEFLAEARKDEKLLEKIKHSDLPVHNAMKELYFKLHDFDCVTSSKAGTGDHLKRVIEAVVEVFNETHKEDKSRATLSVSPGFNGRIKYLVNDNLLGLIATACMENAQYLSEKKIRVHVSQDGESFVVKISPGIRGQPLFKTFLMAAFELKACDEITGGEMSVNREEVRLRADAFE